ncbi:MAG: DUF6702 family protein [Pseudomonadota bacterium]
MRVPRRALALCVASFASSLGAVSAHEQAIAFTEVSFVLEPGAKDCPTDGCRIEVAHRLVIHDAESTLMNVLGARADLAGDSTAQARFEAYAAERFQLIDARTKSAIDLTLLGGEVERGYYWVYQEGKLPPGHETVLVTHSLMMDAVPDQINRVNLLDLGEVETLIFESVSGRQAYGFQTAN